MYQQQADNYRISIPHMAKVLMSSGHQVLLPNVTADWVEHQIDESNVIHVSAAILGEGWSNIMKDGKLLSDHIVAIYDMDPDKVSNVSIRQKIETVAQMNREVMRDYQRTSTY